MNRVHTPTVLQMEAIECGAASMAMILGYYEKYVPLEELRIECDVSRDGSNAFNLLAAGKKYGLAGKGLRLSAEELIEVELPAIILWLGYHYVVLEGFGKHSVYLNDPAIGKRSVTYEEFNQSYSGIALTFQKGEDFQKGGIKPPSVFQKVTQYLKQIPGPVTFLLLTSGCLLLPGFAIPAFLMVFIDTYFSKFHLPWKGAFLSLVAVAVLFFGILNWMQLYFLNWLNTKLASRFSSQFFEHLLKLPMKYFENRPAGVIAYWMSLNNSVAETLTGPVLFTLVHLLFFFFYALAMFAYDPTIAWLGLIAGVLNLATMVFIYRSKSQTLSLLQNDLGMGIWVSVSGLYCMETIKAKGGEDNFFGLWAGHYTKNLNGSQRIEKKDAVLSVLPIFFQMLAWAALLGIGAQRLIDGELLIGKLMALGVLQISFLGPICRFVELSPLIQTLKKETQCLDDVLNNPVDSIDRSPSALFEFQDVTFQYSPRSKPVIQGLSFTIHPGKHLAIVGPNGSGKSTIAKLAAGLYAPTSGQIRYKNSGYVSQDPFLFSGTVRENLTFWDRKVSDNLLIQAAQDARIHEIISLREGGYDSLVEEGGSNFSDGERQQLEIARALLLSPALLILDNATSRLDSETEHFIAQKLKARGYSMLVISDRLSTLLEGAEILVLDENGKIVQSEGRNE